MLKVRLGNNCSLPVDSYSNILVSRLWQDEALQVFATTSKVIEVYDKQTNKTYEWQYSPEDLIPDEPLDKSMLASI
jgi:hypothetical protein